MAAAAMLPVLLVPLRTSFSSVDAEASTVPPSGAIICA
jgi:hypothetical protein